MSGYPIKVPPETRQTIREAASIVRLTLEKKQGCSPLYLPIIEMLEFTLFGVVNSIVCVRNLFWLRSICFLLAT